MMISYRERSERIFVMKDSETKRGAQILLRFFFFFFFFYQNFSLLSSLVSRRSVPDRYRSLEEEREFTRMQIMGGREKQKMMRIVMGTFCNQSKCSGSSAKKKRVDVREDFRVVTQDLHSHLSHSLFFFCLLLLLGMFWTESWRIREQNRAKRRRRTRKEMHHHY